MGIADVRKIFGEQFLRTCAAPDFGGTCRRRIVTGRNIENDKSVPLDPSASVYLVKRVNDELLIAPIVQPIEDGALIMVTHFSTCKDANIFARKGR